MSEPSEHPEQRELPLRRAKGFCFLADPHFAATPPGRRFEGYLEQITAKVRFGLEYAREHELEPVILGDLFHWPRENPNSLLVHLIELLTPFRPWMLVGNHDKHQARYTPDVSLAVLVAAEAVRLIAEPGPRFRLLAPGPDGREWRALFGASPDMTDLPLRWDRGEDDVVLWGSHHNLQFPDYQDKQVPIREIPGVDLVLNGHIHRPQPSQVRGATRWVNVGSLARTQFFNWSLDRQPTVAVWRPGMEDVERVGVPYLPFREVFPDEEPPAEVPKLESNFLAGLERLARRRTREAAGLKEFLTTNLNPEQPVSRLIWELYEEIVDGEK